MRSMWPALLQRVQLRFLDGSSTADSGSLAAARAGLGVLLASLPLVQADLDNGTLKRASTEVLTHHETYWLLATKERVSRRQWHQLAECLVES